MPSAPGSSSSSDAAKVREKQKKQDKDKYKHKVDPSTVEEVVEAGTLDSTYFHEGEWKPAWGNVEFVRPCRLRTRL